MLIRYDAAASHGIKRDVRLARLRTRPVRGARPFVVPQDGFVTA
jgi:hypothetical protein